MEALYVLDYGATIRKEGHTLAIWQNKLRRTIIPTVGLKQLIIMGRTSLTGPVLEFLARHKIDTVFLNSSGRFVSRLLMTETDRVAKRQAQYRLAANNNETVELARIFVRGRLSNQRQLLQRKLAAEDSTRCNAVQKIKDKLSRLDSIHDLDKLRGVEGSGSRLFFALMPLLIKNKNFTFKNRQRRPPRDPVNCLLSFTYTLFFNQLVSAVLASGIDPYVGFLHSHRHGRASLACDLMEEWRILAERLVLKIINTKQLLLAAT